MKKFSFEQIKAMLEKIENDGEMEVVRKNKRKRISIMLDDHLLNEIDRQARDVLYISRNEFIVSALSDFCGEY